MRTPPPNNQPKPTIFIGGTVHRIGVLDTSSIAVYSHCTGAIGSESGDRRIAIKALFKGKEEYRINNQFVSLSAGQFMILNEGQGSSFDYNGNVKSEGLCLRIDSSIIHTVIQSQQSRHGGIPEFDQGQQALQDQPLGRYLISLFEQGMFHKTFSREQSLHFFHQVAEAALQGSGTSCGQKPGAVTYKKQAAKKELSDRLALAQTIMHDHITPVLGMHEVAQKVCLSEYHFMRCFKQAFGYSPYQYYIRIRLTKAVDLIRSSTMRLDEVAFATGFTDGAALNKAFKSMYGICPSLLRNPKTHD